MRALWQESPTMYASVWRRTPCCSQVGFLAFSVCTILLWFKTKYYSKITFRPQLISVEMIWLHPTTYWVWLNEVEGPFLLGQRGLGSNQWYNLRLYLVQFLCVQRVDRVTGYNATPQHLKRHHCILCPSGVDADAYKLTKYIFQCFTNICTWDNCFNIFLP